MTKQAEGPTIRGVAGGRQRLEQELKEQQARKEQQAGQQVLRFWVPVGDKKTIIVVDETPDFFIYEHEMKDPQTGRWGVYTLCLDRNDSCPVCQVHGSSYYALVLSVIDLTPYVNSKGETVPWSRKLLVVKSGQVNKFLRRFDADGTLRGASFDCIRDTNKSPRVGNDIEYLGNYEEDYLTTFVRSWVDKEGKTHQEDCSRPFDYEKLFPVPDITQLQALVGVKSTPGSVQQQAEELPESTYEQYAAWEQTGAQDEGVWEPAASPPQPQPRPAPAAAPAPTSAAPAPKLRSRPRLVPAAATPAAPARAQPTQAQPTPAAPTPRPRAPGRRS